QNWFVNHRCRRRPNLPPQCAQRVCIGPYASLNSCSDATLVRLDQAIDSIPRSTAFVRQHRPDLVCAGCRIGRGRGPTVDGLTDMELRCHGAAEWWERRGYLIRQSVPIAAHGTEPCMAALRSKAHTGSGWGPWSPVVYGKPCRFSAASGAAD